MGNGTDDGLPPRPSNEQIAAARKALDTVGLTKGSIASGGIDDDGRAWIKLKPRYAFLLSLLGLEADGEASSDA